MDFKCPMCRQASHALLCSPKISEPVEPDGNVIDAITHLLEQNVKPCVNEFSLLSCTALVDSRFLLVSHIGWSV